VDAREVGCKKQERLSKDTCCSGYQDQRNILALEVTDEKVHDSKLMKNLVERRVE
jgi:hypothetical protein